MFLSVFQKRGKQLKHFFELINEKMKK